MSAPRFGYTLALLAAAAVVFLPFLALALWCGPIAGDLTRLGGWSERDYGWRARQPRLEVLENAAPGSGPDVLVLGDSFSMGNVWQSEFRRATGLATLSFGYDGAGCLDAFVRSAVAPRHAGARVVVIETIEREFVDRFEAAPSCDDRDPQPFAAAAGHTAIAPVAGDFAVDWRYLLRTASNALQRARAPADAIVGREVVNVPLSESRLFSHRAASRLLYYRGDDAKQGWTVQRIDAALRTFAALDARLAAAGKRLLVVVIPDKSTVYRPFVAGPSTWPEPPDVARLLVERGVAALELRAPMRAAAAATLDLYLPNDTHLSARGFALLGRELAQWRGFVEPVPPGKR